MWCFFLIFNNSNFFLFPCMCNLFFRCHICSFGLSCSVSDCHSHWQKMWLRMWGQPSFSLHRECDWSLLSSLEGCSHNSSTGVCTQTVPEGCAFTIWKRGVHSQPEQGLCITTAHPSREFECAPLYTSVELWSDLVGVRRRRAIGVHVGAGPEFGWACLEVHILFW